MASANESLLNKAHSLLYVETLSEARTKLERFFQHPIREYGSHV